MTKAYQVFVGCPFRKPLRSNYDKLKSDLEAETPLHVVLADTTSISSTDYLLEHITTLIRDSAGCIFDATGGNPNVSLEVGIAHAIPAEYLLTFYTRKPRTKPELDATKAEEALEGEGELKPIISDLQGKARIEYKTYDRLKDQLVKRYLVKLPCVRRWEELRKKHSITFPTL